MRTSYLRILKILLLIMVGGWAGASLPQLANNPPVWFDEAWSLMVAKNWAAHGIYGRSLGSEFVSGMGMAMPVTSTGWFGMVFKFTGFSIYNARLLALVTTVISIGLLYVLTQKLYDEITAILSVIVLLFFSSPGTHPFWFGKQALAEPFLIFYLIAGYLLFTLSFKSKWLTIPAILLLGTGIHAKSHALPFLMAGLFVTAGTAWWHKQGKIAQHFLTVTLGSLIVFFAIGQFEHFIERALPTYGGPIMREVFKNIGLVTHPIVRLETAQYLLVFGLLLMIALAFGFRQQWRFVFSKNEISPDAYLRLAYYGFIFSWYLWFAGLSIGWERYYYPLFFLSAPLQATLLKTLFTRIWRSNQPRVRRLLYTTLALIPLGLFAAFTFASTLFTFQLRNTDLEETAAYIDENIPMGAIVESYDGELFLLLENHAYHYPPDNIQIPLVRQGFLFESQTIDYDAFEGSPAIIVSGPLDKAWGLYPAALMKKHGYLLVYENDSYRVYGAPEDAE